jgi:predicted RNA-binding protein with PUA-like domain
VAAYWLIKSEPVKYSFVDLERDGSTVWDGVRNNQAAIYLRTMKVGDLLLYYHSQEGLEVVGIAKVSKEAFLDPSDPAGRFVAVEVAPVRKLPKPVPLSALKAEPKLAGMAMFRQFRLSVSPVTPEEWKVILELGGT